MKDSIKLYWENTRVFKTIDNIFTNIIRKRISNTNFTILSSNCIGGCIYHRLGHKFLSPTINLFFDNDEFITFCLYIKEYIKEDIYFDRKTHSNFPVGRIGGIHARNKSLPEIKINFVHYDSNAEAEEAWNRRKDRINLENLYIILFNTGITDERLHLLDDYPCNNLAIIDWRKQSDLKNSIYIKPNRSSNYLKRDIFGIRYYEQKWDFVSFINEKR